MVPAPLASSSRASGRNAPATSAAVSPLDDVLLADIARLLGSARLAELLKLLSVDLERKLRLIREAVADADLHRAVHETHSLKGAAASLGARAVAIAAGELEEALATSMPSRHWVVSGSLGRMSGAIAATQSTLASRAADLPSPGLAA